MGTYSANPIFLFEGSLCRHEKSGLVVLEFLNKSRWYECVLHVHLFFCSFDGDDIFEWDDFCRTFITSSFFEGEEIVAGEYNPTSKF